MKQRSASRLFAVALLLSCLFSSAPRAEKAADVEQAVILRLIYEPLQEAVRQYYGEWRQNWRDEVLSVETVEGTPYYKLVVRFETFCGPHNPPYGVDTATFYVSYGDVELRGYEHREN